MDTRLVALSGSLFVVYCLFRSAICNQNPSCGFVHIPRVHGLARLFSSFLAAFFMYPSLIIEFASNAWQK